MFGGGRGESSASDTVPGELICVIFSPGNTISIHCFCREYISVSV